MLVCAFARSHSLHSHTYQWLRVVPFLFFLFLLRCSRALFKPILKAYFSNYTAFLVRTCLCARPSGRRSQRTTTTIELGSLLAEQNHINWDKCLYMKFPCNMFQVLVQACQKCTWHHVSQQQTDIKFVSSTGWDVYCLCHHLTASKYHKHMRWETHRDSHSGNRVQARLHLPILWQVLAIFGKLIVEVADKERGLI